MARDGGRRAAAFAVARWLAERDNIARLIPDGPDRAFVQDLVYTTVRRLRPLRSVLGKLVPRWPKGELEALLCVGGAQILYMPEIPDFAAVSATVEAAKACPNKSVPKVVNAVLRNLALRRGEFEEYLRAAPLAERESFPNALVKRWTERYGEANAEALAKWHNTPAETWIVRNGDGGETFSRLPRGERVCDQPGYAEGAFIVQDPATSHAVDILDVRPGLSILDFCAAPGGKTVRIAWRMRGEGRLVAQEPNPKRLDVLRGTLGRTKTAGFAEACAAAPDGELFDRVLADVPCSNTGVLRRRPDARWRWSAERLAALVELQSGILDAAAARVAPGGLLVYSTCSNEPEENVRQIEAFLARNPAFAAEASRESVPFESGCDGAFACALRRSGRDG